jgi:hypothetical protein
LLSATRSSSARCGLAGAALTVSAIIARQPKLSPGSRRRADVLEAALDRADEHGLHRDIVGAAIGRPTLRYVPTRAGWGEHGRGARGVDACAAGRRIRAVTADDAATGLAAAERELAEGRGAGYGVGFGYVKSFGSPRGLDGIRLEYAFTDGERVANVHAVISGPRLALLGYHRTLDEPDAPLHDWALRVLYDLAGSIARDK